MMHAHDTGIGVWNTDFVNWEVVVCWWLPPAGDSIAPAVCAWSCRRLPSRGGLTLAECVDEVWGNNGTQERHL